VWSRRVLAVALTAVVLANPLAAQTTSLRLQAGTAWFTARATFGPFTGVTSAVTGAVSSPGTERAAAGWVEVLLDSLRTGNGTRDRHMREALETTTHPRARFELDSLVPDPAGTGAGDARPVRLHGRFRVHGVSRPVTASGTLQPHTTGGWQLGATFPVSLPEHQVSKGLSRALGTIRVQPVVQVRVELVFAP
jgi:polyisoprenoid-binding protein YceI